MTLTLPYPSETMDTEISEEISTTREAFVHVVMGLLIAQICYAKGFCQILLLKLHAYLSGAKCQDQPQHAEVRISGSNGQSLLDWH